MKLTKLSPAPGQMEAPSSALQRFALVRIASQLIPGVRRTSRGRERMRAGLMAGGVALFATWSTPSTVHGQLVGVAGAAAVQEQAIRAFIAAEKGEEQYCWTVERRSPPPLLAKRLHDLVARLKPLLDDGGVQRQLCRALLDVGSVKSTEATRVEVTIIASARLARSDRWHDWGAVYRATLSAGEWTLDPVVRKWVE